MAREAGFDLCGIAPAEAFPELEHFDEWLAAGYAGEMRYLERSAVRRADVRNVVPAARSVFDRPTLVDLWRRSDADTQARLADSAMSRAKLKGFRRNVAVALGNIRTAAARAALEAPPDPDHASTQDPVVAEHVGWARRRYGPEDP